MKEVVFAGFGGQGVLTGALALAYIVMSKDVNVTWMPSYGPEMRGGKSKCVVKFGESKEEIIPVPMMEKIDILVAMNTLSLDYLENCGDNAIVMVNDDIVPEDVIIPDNFEVIRIKCNSIAYDTGNPKGISIAMLGALMAKLGFCTREFALENMCKMFEEKGKGKLNDNNIKTFNAGWDVVMSKE